MSPAPGAAALARLAPVGLPELVDRASLQTRVDRKYLVPAGDVTPLLGLLAEDARVLEVAGRRTFGYRSTYFDTTALDGYHAAARRRRHRFKLRTRRYLDSGLAVLELKSRGPRGRTVKERLPWSGAERGLSADDLGVAHERIARVGVDLRGRPLHPVLLTRYDRTTLLLPGSDTRVTLDTGLVWTLADGSGRRATTPRVVVETKTAGAPSEVDRLLWRLGHRPVAISKFGTGLAALRPELASHRWRPLLRRHVDPLPPLRPTASDPSPHDTTDSTDGTHR